MPSYKQRHGFKQKKEKGPFGQFAQLAITAVGGSETAITETAIRNGVKKFKTLMEKKQT